MSVVSVEAFKSSDNLHSVQSAAQILFLNRFSDRNDAIDRHSTTFFNKDYHGFDMDSLETAYI